MDDSLKALNSSLDKILGSMAPEGWEYQDFPKLETVIWEYFLKGFGKENVDYKKITEAVYNIEGKEYKRGQLLLGPNARSNLKKFSEENPIPGESTH